MGDYRYFPEQPGPVGGPVRNQVRGPAQGPLTGAVRGPDPYAPVVPSAQTRRPDPTLHRGYTPSSPQAYADHYHDPYAQNENGDAFDDHNPAFDPYAPPYRAAQPVARGYQAAPPLMQGASYAPPAYEEQRYAEHPRALAPLPVRADLYPDAYAAHPSAAPAWVGPQGGARVMPQRATAAPARAPMRPAAVLHGLGAVISLGLVVLAAGWTWNMMQRDVSGVPVVRALEGPMRIAPENPGGQQAAFQGLAINELAGSGASSEGDVIVLAPPPVGLGLTATPDAIVPPGTELASAEGVAASGEALGFKTPNRLAVQRSPRPQGRGDAGVQLAAAIAAPVSQLPALSTSNDPRAADTLAASIARSVALDLTVPRGIDVDPASIGPGTRLVQLGAYDTPDQARGAWETLSQRFSPLLNDRGRVIEAAHSGGSVFYRLRAHGFTDERDARRFCAALVAQQIDCIPVLVR